MLVFNILLISLPSVALALNFPFERIQLSEAEADSYPAVRFGGLGPNLPRRECKYIPGDDNWPSEEEWEEFNDALEGALLKPKPLASACYNGPDYNAKRCEDLKRQWTTSALHANDPISFMSLWATGYSCVPTSNPNSTCTQGGYPVYVVNATTVRHVQMAVNFARNQNIRLVIKNSGHNYNGLALGGNSLSVWVHNLKDFTYHPEYISSEYSGRAVAYSGGFQALDASAAMTRHNITFISAGGPTVGIAGGFLQGGGHSVWTSSKGLAADQVLSIQAVTADGRFVTADPHTNKDLFWAFRGGGPGNYGIITSVIIKAFPRTTTTSTSINLSTVPGQGNSSGLPLETFWAGMRAYWKFTLDICEAGGLGYNFIRHTPFPSSNTTGYTFTTSISLPNRTTAEHRDFLRPFFQELNALGIPIAIPSSLQIRQHENHIFTDSTFAPEEESVFPRSLHRRALGDKVSSTLIGSRFFTRANHASPAAVDTMASAIRSFIEKENNGGGYTFHGIDHCPSLKVSGFPDNAVQPAYREAVNHNQGYEGNWHWDGQSEIVSFEDLRVRHRRLQSHLASWRAITPNSGSYLNEGDAQEPDWKDSFYGTNYARLADIKRRWDSEGVFWVLSGVGSDEWTLRGSVGGGRSGIFTQDGRLCRV
ncbi:FAD/FMN-containing isoamyl alcohol oxidase-like protein MreA [Dendryphion nanum]|uniref:FAD/FMN-containing isoamyl alcohol oxidase-like protein MreA n=1 Tax=Dendryphion nanum TaxID=256645 RepID=A0A9P9DZR7_9PLEO|nr:FAD/FMN-containing isoamyl alcohol oxidase-like protein MreA [Dendryphion nanum]